MREASCAENGKWITSFVAIVTSLEVMVVRGALGARYTGASRFFSLSQLLAVSAPTVLRALDRFQLFYVRLGPETIADRSDEGRFWSTNSARLNPALQRDLMNSNSFGSLGSRKFSVSQRYTYSTK